MPGTSSAGLSRGHSPLERPPATAGRRRLNLRRRWWGLVGALVCALARADALADRMDEVARDAAGSARAAGRAVAALSAGATPEQRIDAWTRWVVAGLFADGAAPVPAIPQDVVDLAKGFGLTTAHGLFVAHNVGRAQVNGGSGAVRGAEDLSQAVADVRQGGNPTALCLVLFRQGQSHLPSLDIATTATALMEAANVPGASPRCQALAIYSLLLANGYGLSPESTTMLPTALESAKKGLALAPPERYPTVGGRVLMATAYTQTLVGRPRDGMDELERALPLARRAGDLGLLVRVLLTLADAELLLGRPADAADHAEEVLGLGQVRGASRFSALLLAARANAAMQPADPVRARDRLAEARAWLGETQAPDRLQWVYQQVASPVYASLGLYREALEASNALLDLERARVAAEVRAKVAEQGVRFDVERRELETAKLRIAEAELRTRRNLLAAGLALSLAVIAVTAVLLRYQVLQRRRIASLFAQLEQSNATRSEWLARVVHDLRQPAHSLALLADAAVATPSAAGAHAEDIRRNTQLLGDMLSGLLDLSQLERGDYRPVVGPVDLDRLLGEVTSQFRPVCERKGLAMLVQPCGLWVTSDPQLLRRIVFNLVGNAAKYTDRGSVTVQVQRMESVARLQVLDTGRGIPPARIADMLRPYSRLDHGAEEEGLGIGLAVVHQGTQLLGHALAIDSEPGRGTTVSVDLAVCDARPADEPSPSVLPLHEDLLVAVIDDNPEVRRATASLLHGWSVRIVDADDADGLVTALEPLGDPTPSLLLVDYALAHGNGLDCVEQLRSRPGWEGVPAVLVTGAIEREIEERALSLGMEVLYKPVRPARLRRLLSSALGLDGRA